jgi:hypothetical protein
MAAKRRGIRKKKPEFLRLLRLFAAMEFLKLRRQLPVGPQLPRWFLSCVPWFNSIAPAQRATTGMRRMVFRRSGGARRGSER